MKIAVLGTGMVGRGLSQKLASLGHNVTMGTRSVEKTLAVTETDFFGNIPFSEWQNNNAEISLSSFERSASDAELIFVCTHGSVAKQALELAGADNIDGKVVVDVTNGLVIGEAGEQPSLNPVNSSSVGEELQSAFPNAKIVKTLNNVQHSIMVDPKILGEAHNVFISGEEDAAKTSVKDILQSFGWSHSQMIDLGGIQYSRAMEMNVLLWWRMYELLGTGEFNFQLVKEQN